MKRQLYRLLPAVVREHYEAYRFPARYRLPNTIYIETTSACNLNCVMCAAQRPATKRVKPSGYIDVTFFKRLIDELADSFPSVTSVYLHKDGEPLLHPQIIELIDYASSRHANVTLVTNATLLDKEKTEAILTSPLQHIRFSVDGFTRSTFERVRIQRKDNEFAELGVPVGYDAVMANIERFLERRRATGNRRLKVGFRTTNFRATEKELQRYVEYWSERVDFVNVANLASWSGEVGHQEGAVERQPCIAPWASLVVSWDGKLVPCCIYVDTSGHDKGNLFDLSTGTLLAALAAPKRRRLLLAHLDQDLETEAPYCVGCRDWRDIPLPKRKRRAVLRGLRKATDSPTP